MNPAVYQILHVLSLVALSAGAFYSFAAPATSKKKVMMVTGIAAVLLLVSGFGLLAKLHDNQFSAWVIIKLVAWLGLAGLAGIGFRKREKPCVFKLLISALIFLGVFTAYYLRFKL